MWHASVSVQDDSGPLHRPRQAEAIAIASLADVGDPDQEWWFWNRAARVGHLRVPITGDEAELVPAGIVTMDAGESGPLRRRSPVVER